MSKIKFMFLLYTNSSVYKNHLSKIKQLQFYKVSLKGLRNSLKRIKKNKILPVPIKKSILLLDKTISYIISISFSFTNLRVYIKDIKGNVKLTFSAGLFEIPKKQKYIKPITIIKLIHLLKTETVFVRNSFTQLHQIPSIFYYKFFKKPLQHTFYKSFQLLPL